MVWTLCSVVFVPNIKNVKVCETLTDSLWFKFMAVLSPLERMFNGEPSWLELICSNWWRLSQYLPEADMRIAVWH